jgi:hypothetical protein
MKSVATKALAGVGRHGGRRRAGQHLFDRRFGLADFLLWRRRFRLEHRLHVLGWVRRGYLKGDRRGYLAGDRFSVGDAPAGIDLGNTSTPLGLGQYIGSNWDAAYASPLWSHGRWTFGAGSYDITGTAILSPYGGGGAAVELTTGVPEPSTWAMMGLGFAGLAFAGFRARRTPVSIA